MMGLHSLLLIAMATTIPAPEITIDSCVAVDPVEVRRLTAIELDAAPSAGQTLEVVVGCQGVSQYLRLMDTSRGLIASRTIDLSATGEDNRDARARELALAIAELLRRSLSEAPNAQSSAPQSSVPQSSVPQSSAAQSSAPPLGAPQRSAPSGAAQPGAQGDAPEPLEPSSPAINPLTATPWQAEVGISAIAVGWTHGQALFGVDLTGRVHLTRWLLGELRAGGRRTRAVELQRGTVTGQGVAAAGGLAWDTLPGVSWAGVSLGARVGIDWLRYAAVDPDGHFYDGSDAASVTVQAALGAFLSLFGPFRATLNVELGTALNAVAIEEDGQARSGLGGLGVSGALGLAAGF
jgi:hypothetical protein